MTAVDDSDTEALHTEEDEGVPPLHAGVRITRWVAMAAGLIGFVSSALMPVLPVVQTTT